MAARRFGRRALSDTAILVTLAAALVLPGAGTLIGLDPSRAVNEKRVQAPWPGTPRGLRAVQEFPARFDLYLQDRFEFRQLLIRLHNRARLAIEARPTSAIQVVFGRSGWLFYSGDDTLNDLEGRNRFSDAALQDWVRCLQERSRWLAKRGARYLVVIAPGKSTIYPEHLPRWVRPAANGTRLDQLMRAVEGVPDIEVLDLRGALRQAKRKNSRVYLKLDTHWNALGAHAAYASIVERLARWFPTESPEPLSEWELTWKPRPGDLSIMLGLEDLMAETSPDLVRRSPTNVRIVEETAYAAYPTVATERAGAAIGRAVVFRDSFSTLLVPFLSEHFGRSVFLWTFDFDAGVVVREHPDLVIQELTERYLPAIPLKNPALVTADRPSENATPRPAARR